MTQKIPCTTPLGSASRFALSIRISSSIAFIETPDLQERGRETVVVNVSRSRGFAFLSRWSVEASISPS